jgi:hypothetical protein
MISLYRTHTRGKYNEMGGVDIKKSELINTYCTVVYIKITSSISRGNGAIRGCENEKNILHVRIYGVLASY